MTGSSPAAAREPLVALRGVTCRYASEDVLENVDLTISEGEFVGVVGPSGSGKTTLLRAIAGSIVPVSGSATRRQGLRMAYVPQVETMDWNFPVTVEQCVLMARVSGRLLPWPSTAERAAVSEILARLDIEHLRDRHIRQLSGGQQQRVFIARAMLGEPDLLLMDEPTAGVDARLRHEILHLLDDLHGRGLAILLSTHDLNGIVAHLPRMVCLNRCVIGAGRPVDVLTPEILERTYGASMQVLEHGGMPVVVDHFEHRHATGDGHERTHLHGHAHGHTHDHTHQGAP